MKMMLFYYVFPYYNHEKFQSIQKSAKRLVRGCDKFVPALAYLFCQALSGSCLARFAYFLAGLCIWGYKGQNEARFSAKRQSDRSVTLPRGKISETGCN